MAIYGKNHCQSPVRPAGRLLWTYQWTAAAGEAGQGNAQRLPAHLQGRGWGGNHHLPGHTLTVSHSHSLSSKIAPGYIGKFLLPGLCAPLLTGSEQGAHPTPPSKTVENTVTRRKWKGPSVALHVVMRPGRARVAGSSWHNLEVIVLHLVPSPCILHPSQSCPPAFHGPYTWQLKVLQASDRIYFRRQWMGIPWHVRTLAGSEQNHLPLTPKLPSAKRPHLYKGLPALPLLSKTEYRNV